MLRWYLSPSPNFFSDWLWPYCVTWYIFVCSQSLAKRPEDAEFKKNRKKIKEGLPTSVLFHKYLKEKYFRNHRTYHCWYIEPRNREKSLTLIWQRFSCLLDEWIAKVSKKKKNSRWLFEIIHIIRFEIWDLEIWKYFWDMILTM